jgi:DNA-binding NtrC family response regulator
MSSLKILIVDDDPEMVSSLSRVFEKDGLETLGALSATECLERLDKEPEVCAALVDLVMPGMDGITLLEEIKKKSSRVIPVFIMTGYGTIESAVEAVKKGAEDYLLKPFQEEILRKKVLKAIDMLQLRKEVAELRALVREIPEGLIVSSEKMKKVLERAMAAAVSDAPILIHGETGSGKEVLARAIHHRSPYAQGPFVGVNCAAIPRELMESELFGHKRGAFTGAVRDSQGLFVAASGGTIFLDEIGEMPRELQPKLLRALEERKVRPLGSTKEEEVHARVISATNRAVEELKTQYLRQDLFYRISTVIIEIPPLRERPEDIPVLANHFLSRFARKYNKDVRDITPGAMKALARHPFLGNVRELEQLVENVIIFKKEYDPDVTEEDVLKAIGKEASPMPIREMTSLSLKEMEKYAIEQALKVCNNNKTKASHLLGLSRDKLYRRLKAYGIKP